MNFIPQFIPYWDEAEVKAVNKVMKSDYLNEHKTVREFEKKFSQFMLEYLLEMLACKQKCLLFYVMFQKTVHYLIPKNLTLWFIQMVD